MAEEREPAVCSICGDPLEWRQLFPSNQRDDAPSRWWHLDFDPRLEPVYHWGVPVPAPAAHPDTSYGPERFDRD